MSHSIWTECAEKHSDRSSFEGRPYRVVEAQHFNSTRKLVDSDMEQYELERMLEENKPPIPREAQHLHILLSTPFRYPPLRFGSRFGTRMQRGLWYGSETPKTALVETAYYRLLFLEGSAADLTPLSLELTVFQAHVRTTQFVDLTAAPFCDHQDRISSKTSYSDSQALGEDMRASGVEAFRFVSARDQERGANIALFSPTAFAKSRPFNLSTWRCYVAKTVVEMTEKNYLKMASYRFERSAFEVAGALPHPAT